DSLKAQAYDLDVIVVDDGSPNQELLLALYDEFVDDQFRVVLRALNEGKREAQCVAFDLTDAEVVVTVDSDTVLASQDAVLRLVQRLADGRVGAVTGAVAVTNMRENLLTRLIAYRYWSAFHQERAAQSLFHVVACCSGPFAAYRRSVLDRVRQAYTSQRFCGATCTFGDDRHLTNLVLAEGHAVVFDERARAHTAAPPRFRDWLRQQNRWSKSFYRELLWTVRFAHRRHPYLLVDMTFQTLLPLMLIIAAGAVLYNALANDPLAAVHYLALIAAVGTARALYGMARTRDPGFLLFVVYGFIHMFVVKPVSIYALFTMHRTHWGTELAEHQHVPASSARSWSPSAQARRSRRFEASRFTLLSIGRLTDH
ncbi:MAG: glycosyltransferase, partial [Actinobacteria bacterium]|nr:glycosyltransferase [Actinomycetota bacterium]